MYLGLAVSTFLHLALLAWAMLTIQATPPVPEPETPAISVEILTPSDVLRMRKGDETSRNLETKAPSQPTPDQPPAPKEAPKPKPVTAAAPPPPPPPEPKSDPIADKIAALPPEKAPPPPPEKAPPPPPEPALGPTPDEQKALEQKLEQERLADEKRKAEEKRKADLKKAEDLKKKKEQDKKLADARKKAEEAKRQKSLDAIAKAIADAPDDAQKKALVDHSKEKRGGQQVGTDPTAKATGPAAGFTKGTDTVLSLREQDILKGLINSRLKDCWRLPGGGGGVENPIVTVKWHLRPDGTLDGAPTVVQPQGSPTFQLAADAALRAVQCASPFTLPADKYSAWKEITWQFDPTKML